MWNKQASALVGLQARPGQTFRQGQPDTAELVEQEFPALINLRGQAGNPVLIEAVEAACGLALPCKPNTTAQSDAWHALWLSPDEWLLRSAARPALATPCINALQEALEGQFYALNDQSSAYSAVHLHGPQATEVLARGCPLDLHPRVFPAGGCAQSLYFQIPLLLYPLAGTEHRHTHWALLIRRSFADAAVRQLGDALALL